MKKVLAVAITAILFISTFAALTQMTNAQTSATPNLSVSPPLVEHAVPGVPFSVDLVVGGITPDQRVTGIQCRVKYDSTMLEVTGVTEGPFMKDSRWNLYGTTFLSPIDDDLSSYGGNVLVGVLLNPNATNGVWTRFPNGTGTVATITFNAIIPPEDMPATTPLTLANNLIINDNVAEVQSTVTNGIVHIEAQWLSVEPSLVHTVLGETFSVDVVVGGITPDQRVTGIQCRVKYDSTMLEVTGVTEGPFMTDSRWNLHGTYFLKSVEVDPVYGPSVLIGDLLLPDNNGVWTAFPNGIGTVATITFTSIAHPKYVPATTPLTLANNLIINDNLDEVTSSVFSGAVQIDLPPSATLSVYPGRMYAVFNHPIIVSVMINDLAAAWRAVGVQFRLCYDPTMFEVTGVTEGPFMRDSRWNLHGTYFLKSVEVDPVYGPSVLIGDLLLPDNNGEWAKVASGSGAVATITLNPIREVGIDNPTLTSTLSIKNDLIVNDANGLIGEVLHTSNDAEVTILPVRTTLSVDPMLVEAHGVGTTFSVNVSVSELDAYWRATALQFRLQYDAEYLEVVSVTEGPFMTDSRWNLHGTYFIQSVEVDPVYGPCVLVGDLLLPDDNGNWAAFPAGNGTVATVTFKVISLPRGLDQPPTHVHLGLADPFSVLIDDNQEEIATNLLSGEVRTYPTHIADINRDGKVNMLDIGYVAHAFGAKPGHPRWNADYDVVIDGVINMRDVGTVARSFGWVATT